jgi:hypothetical protein
LDFLDMLGFRYLFLVALHPRIEDTMVCGRL